MLQNLILSSVSFGGGHVGFANLGLYPGYRKALGGSIPPPFKTEGAFVLPFLPAYCHLPSVVVWIERLP